MDQFQIYPTHIDEGINAMHEFIIKCGEEPIKPDTCDGKAYTSQKLGALGEQYVKCLLKETDIKKLPEKKIESAPDFEYLFNFFYRPIYIVLKPIQEISKNTSFLSFTQYQYEETIWGLKFKDEHDKLHTIDERLKCVMVIRPYLKLCLFFTSFKHFRNFSVHQYFYFKKF